VVVDVVVVGDGDVRRGRQTLISTAGSFALRSWHATLAGHVAVAVAVKVNDRVNVNVNEL